MEKRKAELIGGPLDGLTVELPANVHRYEKITLGPNWHVYDEYVPLVLDAPVRKFYYKGSECRSAR